MLVDDGSSAVSLPELPLLAVLPGTGGLTRVTDKRKVRRDHADVFCTTEEGVKGKRAVDWRLVDEVVPSSKLDDAGERAREGIRRANLAARRAPRASRLTPLKRERTASWRRIQRRLGRVRADAAARHHHAARTGRAAAAIGRGHGRRRARRSGRCALARELDDAILDIRLNEFDTAAIVFKSAGDPEQVLAYEHFLDANKDHWLAREIRNLLEARAQARRPHLALAGRADRARLLLCRHARRTGLRHRPLLHADRPARGRQQAAGDDRARPT